MSAFRTPLDLRDERNGIDMELLAPLVYDSDLLGCQIVCPTGFVTDFASIPEFLWSVIPPHGPYDHGAVLHDLAYRAGAINGRPITKGQADALFGEAMTVRHTPARLRWTILAGLAMGGWATWRRYRRAPAVAGASS
jgi:hypothetical protein